MRGPRLRLLLVLLVLTALTLTVLDSRDGGSPLDPLRRGSDAVFGPAQRAVGSAAGSAGDALGGLGRIGGFRADNERLEAENEALRQQVLALERLLPLQEQFEQLQLTRDLATVAMVPANVVGFGPVDPFEQTVTLDVGSQDGVAVGQTVVSGDGLVGRTISVGPVTCVVALITDATFQVSSRLNRAPSQGFISGNGGPLLDFELFALDDGSALEPGDDLITSGSDTFVPGIAIGRITEVQGSPALRTATVEPFVDVDSLDLVGVVVEGPRGEPRPLLPESTAPGPS